MPARASRRPRYDNWASVYRRPRDETGHHNSGADLSSVERCANRMVTPAFGEQRVAAGQDVESRDGDSNPGPAHYE
jgi:hypothetical protein